MIAALASFWEVGAGSGCSDCRIGGLLGVLGLFGLDGSAFDVLGFDGDALGFLSAFVELGGEVGTVGMLACGSTEVVWAIG